MRKLSFILNPNASGFKNFDFEGKIINFLEKKEINFEYEILKTKLPKDAIELSKNAIKNGSTDLIAVGGDGTINEVASVVVNYENINLGIIPAGTGNDLVNSLNRSDDFDYSMNLLINGNIEKYDYGVFDKGIFLNVASVGFDAEVVNEAIKIKKYIKNGLSYKLAIISALLKHKRKKYKVIVDDVEYEKDLFLVAIGIGGKYGGNINILPKADMKDGILDICAIEFKSKINILFKIPKLLKATHIEDEVTTYIKGKNVKIYSNDIKVNFDGEYLDGIDYLEFNSSNSKINIIS